MFVHVCVPWSLLLLPLTLLSLLHSPGWQLVPTDRVVAHACPCCPRSWAATLPCLPLLQSVFGSRLLGGFPTRMQGVQSSCHIGSRTPVAHVAGCITTTPCLWDLGPPQCSVAAVHVLLCVTQTVVPVCRDTSTPCWRRSNNVWLVADTCGRGNLPSLACLH
jgi:hypothetical protein